MHMLQTHIIMHIVAIFHIGTLGDEQLKEIPPSFLEASPTKASVSERENTSYTFNWLYLYEVLIHIPVSTIILKNISLSLVPRILIRCISEFT